MKKVITCKICKEKFIACIYTNKSTPKYCCMLCRDKDKEFINKIRNSKLGDKNPSKRLEVRRKISETITKQQKWKKENNPNWKGGITSKEEKFRKDIRVRMWREQVFERDNYTCQECGSKERLCAHHIKSFHKFPLLRFSLCNGKTLCHSCHATLTCKTRWGKI